MKALVVFAVAFALLSALAFTVYFHEVNDPWGGWFVPAWIGSGAAAMASVSCVGISRAVSEIASGEVGRRRCAARAAGSAVVGEKP